MFQNTLQLSIPDPCHEDWNQMTPQENGRYCTQCSKVLTDFTQMSDQEIIQFFENNTENVCGRLTKTQTQKIYYHYLEENKSNFYLPRIAASWLLVSWLSLSPNVNAQDLKPERTEQLLTDTTSNQPSAPRILRGTVFDTKPKEPLIGTSIIFENTERGTISDIDGKFELEIPANIPLNTNIVFKFVEYDDVYIPINTIDFSKELEIVMKKQIINHLDVVVCGRVLIDKKHIRQNRRESRKSSLPPYE